MQLKDLKVNKTKTKKRVGRGGSRGKTSGKGGKGQTARSGNSTRAALRDFIKKIPKLRGRGKNKFASVKVKPTSLSLGRLDGKFKDGEEVSPKTLFEKGLIKRSGGKYPEVKLLASGELSAKLSVIGCKTSKTAKEIIEKAGGTVNEKAEKLKKKEAKSK